MTIAPEWLCILAPFAFALFLIIFGMSILIAAWLLDVEN